MMLRVPPPTRIAIGFVEIAGKRYEVITSPEWARYFDSLNTTTNDTVAAVNNLNSSGGLGVGMLGDSDSAGESIVVIQGTPGQKGDPGPAIGMLVGDGDMSPEFAPGPPGIQGAIGLSGPPLFLLQDTDNNDAWFPQGASEPPIAPGTAAQYRRGDKTWQTLNQAAVAGLTTADTPQFAGIKPYSGQQANVGPGNVNIATTSDTGGFCIITSRQGGVGTSTWVVSFNNRGGTLTMTTRWTDFVSADPITSIAASGANIQVTLGFANTNVQYGFVYIPT